MFNYANSAVLVLLISFLIAVAKPYKDEVIVYFKDGVSSQSISGLSIKKINGKKAVIKLPKNKDMKEFLKDLKKRSDILYAVPNYIIKKQLVPNDPMYKDQWYLKKINIENAWDISTGSSTVYVAVLDTGVDYNHEDLKDNIWLNQGETIGVDSNNNGLDDGCENDVDDDNNGYIDDCYGFNAVAGKGSALDDDGHGTHVSGEIGAIGNNNVGIAGINWNVKIVPCKFLDSNGYGDLNDLLECLKYVKTLKDNGLNIVAVNASYGYNGTSQELNIDCNQVPDAEKCLMQSIDALFTVASGNGGSDLKGDDNDKYIFLPCNYSTVLNNVICVGSTNSNDEKSSFSNYGAKTVNIFAPGGEINGIKSSILSSWLKTNNNTSKNELSTGIIKNFSATITEGIGIIPTTYKFTWNLNNFYQRCGIDFDNDGNIDRTINNCSISNFTTYTYYKNNYYAQLIVCGTNGDVIDTKITQALVEPYTSEVGTSQAAPIIAGTIALLKAANPNLTLQDIKNRILTTGDNLLSLTGYSTTCNRVNVYNALIDEESPKICIDKHLVKINNELIYDISGFSKGNLLSFNIKNTGSRQLIINSVYLSNNIDFLIQNSNCINKVLNPFESCNITIEVLNNNPSEDILNIETNTKYNILPIKLTSNITTASMQNTNLSKSSNVNLFTNYLIQKVDTIIPKNYKDFCSIAINKDNNTNNKDSGGCSFSPNSLNIYWIILLLLIFIRRIKK